jgi:peptidoglycan/LPS O-acetylase OafA/YrhL
MSASLKYRPDIDGLRAVAVLGVIVYHAFPQNLPGGYVGVDIFFVISGYLIGGILFKGMTEGGFRFREFYARRVRRLFPSLITVLGLCLLYGHFVLFPDEYAALGKHLAAGTIFVQNIVFWQESGYFDTAATLKPLLHLWSLAVEEQFYIFFPPLLLLLWRKRAALPWIMVLLLVVSFSANVHASIRNAGADFFLTPYRAWEFLAGSLLAWRHHNGTGGEGASRKLAPWLSVVGAVLLVVSMTALKKIDPFPGWRAALPVAGSVLLIAAGRGSWINSRVLSHPAAVWLGHISYPLYLFHWPLLSFLFILKGEKPPDVLLAGALLLTFLLTVATYYLVERPARFSKSRRVTPLLVILFMITGCLGVLAWMGVLPSVPVTPEIRRIQDALRDRKSFQEFRRIDLPGGVAVHAVGGNGPQTLFYGDSFIQHYMPRIRELLKDNAGEGRGAVFVARGGACPIPGVECSQWPECPRLQSDFRKVLAKDPRIDRLVIAARWQLHFRDRHLYGISGKYLSDPEGAELAYASLSKLLGEIPGNIKVSIVLCIPAGKELDAKRYVTRPLFGSGIERGKTLGTEEFLAEASVINERLRKIAAQHGAEVIDPAGTFCVGGECLRENADGPVRYDEGHLRPGFVKEGVTYLDAAVAP